MNGREPKPEEEDEARFSDCRKPEGLDGPGWDQEMEFPSCLQDEMRLSSARIEVDAVAMEVEVEALARALSVPVVSEPFDASEVRSNLRRVAVAATHSES